MILAQGTLLPDSQLSQVLSGLEGEIDRTRASQALSAEVVIQTCARLLDRLDRGELDGLLAQYATPQILEALARYRALLRPESLRYKLSAELGDLADGPLSRPFGRSLAVPLGTLLHITAGNLDGLPAFSALEGLLTGNVNILKLPRGDSGLSLTLLHLLTGRNPGSPPSCTPSPSPPPTPPPSRLWPGWPTASLPGAERRPSGRSGPWRRRGAS